MNVRPQMQAAIDAPPLSLYVHLPWCVRKCPYCDFNSHGIRDTEPPYAAYVQALLADLDADLAAAGPALRERPIHSVFLGGGTPSLFAPELIARLLDGVQQRLRLVADCETTLETNPGTVEHGNLGAYLKAGVNRLSFGVQSFDDAALLRLGRIHSAQEADTAIKLAQDAGFQELNLDLMYALPAQSIAGALNDLERAIALAPTHLSHYQLTLEPHTPFAAHPPAQLPDEDRAWTMQERGQQQLAAAGFEQYEVSAYARAGHRCRHNLNYWEFGDYLGIGAGAHAKLSLDGQVRRSWKSRLPRHYLEHAGTPARLGGEETVTTAALPFEYMLNALRLIDGVPLQAFCARTQLPASAIAAPLREARRRGWLEESPHWLRATPLGQRFLNDVIALFLI